MNSAKAAYESSKFQFTHPVRGATDETGIRWQVFAVSIHAPREGCDSSSSSSPSEPSKFQFTHPVRGAT